MKGKIKFLLLLLPVVFFAIVVGGTIPYFLLYTLLALVILPILHSLIGILTIKGKINMEEGEIYAGESIEIEYKVLSKLPISFPKLELDNNIAYRLTGKKPPRERFSLVGKEPYYNKIKVVCRRRGDYEIGHFKITIEDIFSCFKFSKRISIPIGLRVYPKIVPIYSLPLKAIIPMGEIRVTNQLLQDYTEISDLKPYELGDSIKKIHWKASAKQDEFLVKNFEPKGDTHVAIFINSSAASYINDKDRLIEDQAVETALSIVNYCLNQGVKVSLCYEEEGKRVYVEGNYLSDLRSFMDRLVLFSPKENVDFASQAFKYSSVFSQGATTIFITPTIDKELAAQSIHWKMKGINPVYILLKASKTSNIKEDTKLVIQKLMEEGVDVYELTNMAELSIGLEDGNEKAI